MTDTVPKGDLVTGPDSLLPSKTTILSGPWGVTLVPSNPAHTPLLCPLISLPEHDNLWTYLPIGPFHTPLSFASHMNELITGPKFTTYTIFSKSHDIHPSTSPTPETSLYGAAVGLIAYLNIIPSNRSIELGHVVFSPLLQKTTEATVAMYILMKHAFEDLMYLRVEWKANNFNKGSKRAAMRLGFREEGVFRKHMVVKGRRRDTWWGSVVDDEWFGREGNGNVGGALEGWLSIQNFDREGCQKRKLEGFREELGRVEVNGLPN